MIRFRYFLGVLFLGRFRYFLYLFYLGLLIYSCGQDIIIPIDLVEKYRIRHLRFPGLKGGERRDFAVYHDNGEVRLRFSEYSKDVKALLDGGAVVLDIEIGKVGVSLEVGGVVQELRVNKNGNKEGNIRVKFKDVTDSGTGYYEYHSRFRIFDDSSGADKLYMVIIRLSRDDNTDFSVKKGAFRLHHSGLSGLDLLSGLEFTVDNDRNDISCSVDYDSALESLLLGNSKEGGVLVSYNMVSDLSVVRSNDVLVESGKTRLKFIKQGVDSYILLLDVISDSGNKAVYTVRVLFVREDVGSGASNSFLFFSLQELGLDLKFAIDQSSALAGDIRLVLPYDKRKLDLLKKVVTPVFGITKGSVLKVGGKVLVSGVDSFVLDKLSTGSSIYGKELRLVSGSYERVYNLRVVMSALLPAPSNVKWSGVLKKNYVVGGGFSGDDILNNFSGSMDGYYVKEISNIFPVDVARYDSSSKRLEFLKSGIFSGTVVLGHRDKESIVFHSLGFEIVLSAAPVGVDALFWKGRLSKKWVKGGRFDSGSLFDNIGGAKLGYKIAAITTFTDSGLVRYDSVSGDLLFLDGVGRFSCKIHLESPGRVSVILDAKFEVLRSVRSVLFSPLKVRYASDASSRVISGVQIESQLGGDALGKGYGVLSIDSSSFQGASIGSVSVGGRSLVYSGVGRFSVEIDFVSGSSHRIRKRCIFIVEKGVGSSLGFSGRYVTEYSVGGRILRNNILGQVTGDLEGYELISVDPVLNPSPHVTVNSGKDMLFKGGTGVFSVDLTFEHAFKATVVVRGEFEIRSPGGSSVRRFRFRDAVVKHSLGGGLSSSDLLSRVTGSDKSGYRIKAIRNISPLSGLSYDSVNSRLLFGSVLGEFSFDMVLTHSVHGDAPVLYGCVVRLVKGLSEDLSFPVMSKLYSVGGFFTFADIFRNIVGNKLGYVIKEVRLLGSSGGVVSGDRINILGVGRFYGDIVLGHALKEDSVIRGVTFSVVRSSSGVVFGFDDLVRYHSVGGLFHSRDILGSIKVVRGLTGISSGVLKGQYSLDRISDIRPVGGLVNSSQGYHLEMVPGFVGRVTARIRLSHSVYASESLTGIFVIRKSVAPVLRWQVLNKSYVSGGGFTSREILDNILGDKGGYVIKGLELYGLTDVGYVDSDVIKLSSGGISLDFGIVRDRSFSIKALYLEHPTKGDVVLRDVGFNIRPVGYLVVPRYDAVYVSGLGISGSEIARHVGVKVGGNWRVTSLTGVSDVGVGVISGSGLLIKRVGLFSVDVDLSGTDLSGSVVTRKSSINFNITKGSDSRDIRFRSYPLAISGSSQVLSNGVLLSRLYVAGSGLSSLGYRVKSISRITDLDIASYSSSTGLVVGSSKVGVFRFTMTLSHSDYSDKVISGCEVRVIKSGSVSFKLPLGYVYRVPLVVNRAISSSVISGPLVPGLDSSGYRVQSFSDLRLLTGGAGFIVLSSDGRRLVMSALGRFSVSINFEHATKLDVVLTGVVFEIVHGVAPVNIGFRPMERVIGSNVKFYNFQILNNLNVSTCGKGDCSELAGYILKSVVLRNKVGFPVVGDMVRLGSGSIDVLGSAVPGRFLVDLVLTDSSGSRPDFPYKGLEFILNKGDGESLGFRKLVKSYSFGGRFSESEINGSVYSLDVANTSYRLKRLLFVSSGSSLAALSGDKAIVFGSSVGKFSAVGLFSHPRKKDVRLNMSFEIIKNSDVLRSGYVFDKRSLVYSSGGKFYSANILGGLRAVGSGLDVSGYRIKSISGFSPVVRVRVDGSHNLLLKSSPDAIGSFSATIVFEHAIKSDISLTGCSFEVKKGLGVRMSIGSTITKKYVSGGFFSELDILSSVVSVDDIRGYSLGEVVFYPSGHRHEVSSAVARLSSDGRIILMGSRRGLFRVKEVRFVHAFKEDVVISDVGFESTLGSSLSFPTFTKSYSSGGGFSERELLGNVVGLTGVGYSVIADRISNGSVLRYNSSSGGLEFVGSVGSSSVRLTFRKSGVSDVSVLGNFVVKKALVVPSFRVDKIVKRVDLSNVQVVGSSEIVSSVVGSVGSGYRLKVLSRLSDTSFGSIGLGGSSVRIFSGKVGLFSVVAIFEHDTRSDFSVSIPIEVEKLPGLTGLGFVSGHTFKKRYGSGSFFAIGDVGSYLRPRDSGYNAVSFVSLSGVIGSITDNGKKISSLGQGRFSSGVVLRHAFRSDVVVRGLFEFLPGLSPSNVRFNSLKKAYVGNGVFSASDILDNLNNSTCGSPVCSVLDGYEIDGVIRLLPFSVAGASALSGIAVVGSGSKFISMRGVGKFLANIKFRHKTGLRLPFEVKNVGFEIEKNVGSRLVARKVSKVYSVGGGFSASDIFRGLLSSSGSSGYRVKRVKSIDAVDSVGNISLSGRGINFGSRVGSFRGVVIFEHSEKSDVEVLMDFEVTRKSLLGSKSYIGYSSVWYSGKRISLNDIVLGLRSSVSGEMLGYRVSGIVSERDFVTGLSSSRFVVQSDNSLKMGSTYRSVGKSILRIRFTHDYKEAFELDCVFENLKQSSPSLSFSRLEKVYSVGGSFSASDIFGNVVGSKDGYSVSEIKFYGFGHGKYVSSSLARLFSGGIGIRFGSGVGLFYVDYIKLVHSFKSDVYLRDVQFRILPSGSTYFAKVSKVYSVGGRLYDRDIVLGLRGAASGYALSSLTGISDLSKAVGVLDGSSYRHMDMLGLGTFSADLVFSLSGSPDISISAGSFEFTKRSSLSLRFKKKTYSITPGVSVVLGLSDLVSSIEDVSTGSVVDFSVYGGLSGIGIEFISVSDSNLGKISFDKRFLHLPMVRSGVLQFRFRLSSGIFSDTDVVGEIEILRAPAVGLRIVPGKVFRSSFSFLGKISGSVVSGFTVPVGNGYSLKGFKDLSLVGSGNIGDVASVSSDGKGLLMRGIGIFTATGIFEHAYRLDSEITGIRFEIIKGSAPQNIRFNKYSVVYRVGSAISYSDIFRRLNVSTCGLQLCGALNGYDISSISLRKHSGFSGALSSIVVDDISGRRLVHRGSGSFYADVSLVHGSGGRDDFVASGLEIQITAGAAPILTQDSLVFKTYALSGSFSEAEILAKVGGAKSGYYVSGIRDISVGSDYVRLNSGGNGLDFGVRHGRFKVRLVLSHLGKASVEIPDFEFLIESQPAERLGFTKLTKSYRSSGYFTESDILGNVVSFQGGDKTGYSVKSISNISDSRIARVSGSGKFMEFVGVAAGSFTCDLVLGHALKGDVTFVGASFELSKARGESLSWGSSLQEFHVPGATISSDEMIAHLSGNKSGYSVKNVTNLVITTSGVSSVGTVWVPNDKVIKVPDILSFSADLFLEHPVKGSVRISGATFQVVRPSASTILWGRSLTKAYSSGGVFSVTEIFGNISGAKTGYRVTGLVLKDYKDSSDNAIASVTSDFSVNILAGGSFKADITLEHNLKSSVVLRDCIMKINKLPAPTNIVWAGKMSRGYVAGDVFTKADVFSNFSGSTAGYSIKEIKDISDSSVVDYVDGDLKIKAAGSFTVTILLESRTKADIRFVSNAFEVDGNLRWRSTLVKPYVVGGSFSALDIFKNITGYKAGYSIRSIRILNGSRVASVSSVDNSLLFSLNEGVFSADISLFHRTSAAVVLRNCSFRLVDLRWKRVLEKRYTSGSVFSVSDIEGNLLGSDVSNYSLLRVILSDAEDKVSLGSDNKTLTFLKGGSFFADLEFVYKDGSKILLRGCSFRLLKQPAISGASWDGLLKKTYGSASIFSSSDIVGNIRTASPSDLSGYSLSKISEISDGSVGVVSSDGKKIFIRGSGRFVAKVVLSHALREDLVFRAASFEVSVAANSDVLSVAPISVVWRGVSNTFVDLSLILGSVTMSSGTGVKEDYVLSSIEDITDVSKAIWRSSMNRLEILSSSGFFYGTVRLSHPLKTDYVLRNVEFQIVESPGFFGSLELLALSGQDVTIRYSDMQSRFRGLEGYGTLIVGNKSSIPLIDRQDAEFSGSMYYQNYDPTPSQYSNYLIKIGAPDVPSADEIRVPCRFYNRSRSIGYNTSISDPNIVVRLKRFRGDSGMSFSRMSVDYQRGELLSYSDLEANVLNNRYGYVVSGVSLVDDRDVSYLEVGSGGLIQRGFGKLVLVNLHLSHKKRMDVVLRNCEIYMSILNKAPVWKGFLRKAYTPVVDFSAAAILENIRYIKDRGYLIKSVVVPDIYKSYVSALTGVGGHVGLIRVTRASSFYVELVLENVSGEVRLSRCDFEVTRLAAASGISWKGELGKMFSVGRLDYHEILGNFNGGSALSGYQVKRVSEVLPLNKVIVSDNDEFLLFKGVGSFRAKVVLEHAYKLPLAFTGLSFKIYSDAAPAMTWGKGGSTLALTYVSKLTLYASFTAKVNNFVSGYLPSKIIGNPTIRRKSGVLEYTLSSSTPQVFEKTSNGGSLSTSTVPNSDNCVFIDDRGLFNFKTEYFPMPDNYLTFDVELVHPTRPKVILRGVRINIKKLEPTQIKWGNSTRTGGGAETKQGSLDVTGSDFPEKIVLTSDMIRPYVKGKEGSHFVDSGFEIYNLSNPWNTGLTETAWYVNSGLHIKGKDLIFEISNAKAKVDMEFLDRDGKFCNFKLKEAKFVKDLGALYVRSFKFKELPNHVFTIDNSKAGSDSDPRIIKTNTPITYAEMERLLAKTIDVSTRIEVVLDNAAGGYQKAFLPGKTEAYIRGVNGNRVYARRSSNPSSRIYPSPSGLYVMYPTSAIGYSTNVPSTFNFTNDVIRRQLVFDKLVLGYVKAQLTVSNPHTNPVLEGPTSSVNSYRYRLEVPYLDRGSIFRRFAFKDFPGVLFESFDGEKTFVNRVKLGGSKFFNLIRRGGLVPVFDIRNYDRLYSYPDKISWSVGGKILPLVSAGDPFVYEYAFDVETKGYVDRKKLIIRVASPAKELFSMYSTDISADVSIDKVRKEVVFRSGYSGDLVGVLGAAGGVRLGFKLSDKAVMKVNDLPVFSDITYVKFGGYNRVRGGLEYRLDFKVYSEEGLWDDWRLVWRLDYLDRFSQYLSGGRFIGLLSQSIPTDLLSPFGVHGFGYDLDGSTIKEARIDMSSLRNSFMGRAVTIRFNLYISPRKNIGAVVLMSNLWRNNNYLGKAPGVGGFSLLYRSGHIRLIHNGGTFNAPWKEGWSLQGLPNSAKVNGATTFHNLNIVSHTTADGRSDTHWMNGVSSYSVPLSQIKEGRWYDVILYFGVRDGNMTSSGVSRPTGFIYMHAPGYGILQEDFHLDWDHRYRRTVFDSSGNNDVPSYSSLVYRNMKNDDIKIGLGSPVVSGGVGLNPFYGKIANFRIMEGYKHPIEQHYDGRQHLRLLLKGSTSSIAMLDRRLNGSSKKLEVADDSGSWSNSGADFSVEKGFEFKNNDFLSLAIKNGKSFVNSDNFSIAFSLDASSPFGSAERVILSNLRRADNGFSLYCEDGYLGVLFRTKDPNRFSDGDVKYKVSSRLKVGIMNRCLFYVNRQAGFFELWMNGSKVLKRDLPFDHSFRLDPPFPWRLASNFEGVIDGMSLFEGWIGRFYLCKGSLSEKQRKDYFASGIIKPVLAETPPPIKTIQMVAYPNVPVLVDDEKREILFTGSWFDKSLLDTGLNFRFTLLEGVRLLDRDGNVLVSGRTNLILDRQKDRFYGTDFVTDVIVLTFSGLKIKYRLIVRFQYLERVYIKKNIPNYRIFKEVWDHENKKLLFYTNYNSHIVSTYDLKADASGEKDKSATRHNASHVGLPIKLHYKSSHSPLKLSYYEGTGGTTIQMSETSTHRWERNAYFKANIIEATALYRIETPGGVADYQIGFRHPSHLLFHSVLGGHPPSAYVFGKKKEDVKPLQIDGLGTNHVDVVAPKHFVKCMPFTSSSAVRLKDPVSSIQEMMSGSFTLSFWFSVKTGLSLNCPLFSNMDWNGGNYKGICLWYLDNRFYLFAGDGELQSHQFASRMLSSPGGSWHTDNLVGSTVSVDRIRLITLVVDRKSKTFTLWVGKDKQTVHSFSRSLGTFNSGFPFYFLGGHTSNFATQLKNSIGSSATDANGVHIRNNPLKYPSTSKPLYIGEVSFYKYVLSDDEIKNQINID